MREVTLKQREQARIQVLNTVLEHHLPIAQAAEIMGISERHTKRLLAAYRKDGPAALSHGNRGRRPHNAVPEAAAAAVVKLASNGYAGANHSHFTELLREREGIDLSRPTVRRILVKAGIGSPRSRRSQQHRFRRKRMPQEGMLIQVANAREHGTTHRVPRDMLAEEHRHLGKLPEERGLAPYLREDRTVARDGYVSFEGSRYGVHWQWAGSTVQVGVRAGTVEIWAGDGRIATHPRAQSPGRRFTLPGQWSGLPRGDGRPRREAVAVQVPLGEVERRSLDVYELAALGGAR